MKVRVMRRLVDVGASSLQRGINFAHIIGQVIDQVFSLVACFQPEQLLECIINDEYGGWIRRWSSNTCTQAVRSRPSRL